MSIIYLYITPTIMIITLLFIYKITIIEYNSITISGKVIRRKKDSSNISYFVIRSSEGLCYKIYTDDEDILTGNSKIITIKVRKSFFRGYRIVY